MLGSHSIGARSMRYAIFMLLLFMSVLCDRRAYQNIPHLFCGTNLQLLVVIRRAPARP